MGAMTDLKKLEELARRIVERVAETAVRLAIVRHSLVTEDDDTLDEDRIVEDIQNCCLGDETGCLDPEEMDETNCDLMFVQKELSLLEQEAACEVCSSPRRCAHCQPEGLGLCGENAYLPIEKVNGCGHKITSNESLYRCGSCGIGFHRTCLHLHFGKCVAREQEWVSVETAMPPLMCTVIVWDGADKCWESAQYIGDGEWKLERTDGQDDALFLGNEVTHWKAILPPAAPPQAAQEPQK